MRILVQPGKFIICVQEILRISATTPIVTTCLCSGAMSFQTNPGILGHSRPRLFPSIFTPFRHTIPFDALSSRILTVTSENIKIPQNCNVTTSQLIHSTSSPLPPFLSENSNIRHSGIENLKAITE